MSRFYSPEDILLKGKRFVLSFSLSEIENAVDRIASRLDRDFEPEEGEASPLLVCVLKGATPFFSDLIRRLCQPVQLDFVRASSYGGEMVSSGSLTFTAEPGTEIRGRNVIVVEDIIDTGRTASALRRYFHQKGAASVTVAALLYKPEAGDLSEKPDYVGFEIPDRFVVGYGLDYAEEGRNLAGIYVLDE
ncbi:MAG: hypoxanthine phosphoribosyltransferase [Ignavibacteriae bacterium]|nr:hypoxanthine phosphoribosyltransferase [Ignavibacteriota bacterium]MCB9217587.1 hypoxanthine phosphoribosyltransferase [Ignavibacteria bacterium]